MVEFDNINHMVHVHEIQAEWPYKSFAEMVYYYLAKLGERFFDNCSEPFFHCGPIDKRTVIKCRSGLNDYGAQFDTMINTKALWLPRYQIAGLLAHGMIHQWQEKRNAGSPSGNHNADFTRRAFDSGIEAGRGTACKIISYGAVFMEFIKEIDPRYLEPCVEGVTAPEVAEPKPKPTVYSCGCRTYRLLPGVHLACNDCGKPVLPKD